MVLTSEKALNIPGDAMRCAKRRCFFGCWVFVGLFFNFPMFLGIGEGYVAPVRIPIPTSSLSPDPPDESRMIADVNRIRVAAGVPPLARDPKMAVMARAYAHDMGARRYFGHYNPEKQSLVDRFDMAGIAYQFAGENIAFVQSETEAMDGFLKSPDHRANILSPDYTRIGVGIIVTHGYGTIYVQEFFGGSRVSVGA